MSIVDVLIPLIGGIVLVAFPDFLTHKTDSLEEATKKKSKLRKLGYVLLGVAALYCLIVLAQPR